METTQWKEEDADIVAFLREQKAVPFDAMDDPMWWEGVSDIINGIDFPFLKREFGRMQAWIQENPNKKPATPGGWKRFVRRWLEKGYEQDRKRR